MHDTQEYLVTGIDEKAFEKIDIEASIRFTKDSEIEFIGKSVFLYATITSILIPPKVNQIEENTFAFCNKLYRVEFHPNSKLKSIKQNAFLNSSIKSLIIPSCVSDLQKGWCKGISQLVTILLMPSDEENILYYDKKFIIGKSDPKSDIFDVLFFARRDIKEALIPPFIKQIEPYAFENCKNLQKVEFAEKSQLKTIGSFAFSNTSLKSLVIPSSVIEFQNGWCCNNPFLTDIKITESEEHNILYYENKFLIRKTDPKSDIFENLLFAPRDIKEVFIPSFIKRIDSYAFNNCMKLAKVEFELNSTPKTIDENAFSRTSICHISIPPSVNIIGKYSFFQCPALQSFEIKNVNETLLISEGAFCNSPLRSLTIPSSGIEFQKNWCYNANKLNDIKIISNGEDEISYYDNKFIIGKSDFLNKNFDVLIFVRRDLNEPIITIPSFIKLIDPFAFDQIQGKIVQFAENSQMQFINNFAFTKTTIESITIPSHITQIGQSAFMSNSNLKNFQFASKSQLKLIKAYAFYNSALTSITIPSSVTKIEQFAFQSCSNLSRVEFASNSQLRIIEKCAFSTTNIQKIIIPSHVICIEQSAFYKCQMLRNIEFEDKSELQAIGAFSFSLSLIEGIIIPSSVLYIEKNAFYLCQCLTYIKFEKNSSLRLIGSYAFSKSSIERIQIPSEVVLIDDYAFNTCTELNEIIFPEDSKLYYIGYNAFKSTAIKSLHIPRYVINW